MGENGVVVNALVLAGRANRGAFADMSSAPLEALIEINGRPMVSYVVDALNQAAAVQKVVVVGPRQHLEPVLGRAAEIVESGDTLAENLRRGAAALVAADAAHPLLVVGCDVPLLTGEVVDAFISACQQLPASFHYPIIPRSACEAMAPGARRTYATLREGTFTGGNLFLLAPSIVTTLLGLVDRFYAARKSPLRLARLLGLGLLIKFLAGRASIVDVERLFRRLTGEAGRAVIIEHPEVGMDVDKPEDLHLMRRLLEAG